MNPYVLLPVRAFDQACTGLVRARARTEPVRVRNRHRPSWLRGNAGRRFRRALANAHHYRCFYCRRGFAHHNDITLDHYIARRWWPRGYPRTNIVPACEPCNAGKRDALPWPLVWLLLQASEAS